MPSITQLSQRKSTTHMLDPNDILADPSQNARFGDPDPEKVNRIVQGFLEVGQLEAVSVRSNPDRTLNPLLVFGFHRWRAAQIINQNGLTGPAHTGDNGPFLLECKVLEAGDGSDLGALIRSIMENDQRAESNPMDDARNLHRLTTDFGMSRKEASAIYGKTPSFASRRLALLTLSPDLQAKVAKGELGVAAAEELAKADEEVREEVAAKIRKGERVVKEAVVMAGRDETGDKATRRGAGKAAADPNPDSADGVADAVDAAPAPKRKAGRPKAASRSRTTKEVRVLLKSFMEDDEPSLTAVGVLLSSWMDGKLTNNGLRRKLLPLMCKEEGK